MDQCFQRFRPICALLAQQPNLELLRKLDELCTESSSQELEQLQEYILFPLQVYLKSPQLYENFTIAVMDFISNYFSRKNVLVDSFFILKDVTTHILTILSGLSVKEGGLSNVDKPISEDLRISGLKCIRTLVKSVSKDEILVSFFSEDMKLALGHLTFLALDWAQNEVALKKLNLVTLDLLESFIPTEIKVKEQFCRTFGGLLPGISTALIKIIKDPDFRRSLKVKTLALRTWTQYVTCLLGDEQVGSSPNVNLEWLNKAKDHMLMQLQVLLSLSHSLIELSSVTLREEMFHTVLSLHNLCGETLSNLIYVEIQLLASLSVKLHNETKIHIKCQDLLGKVFLANPSIDKAKLVQECQQDIFELSLDLEKKPGLFENVELGRKLMKMESQFVLLSFTRNESYLFLSQTYLDQLLNGLLKVIQLESTPHISEFYFEDDLDLDYLFQPELELKNPARPKKYFVYLRTEELRERFLAVVSSLIEHAHFRDLIRSILESLNGSKPSSTNQGWENHQRELVLLLNQVLQVLLVNHESSIRDSQSDMAEMFELMLSCFLKLDLVGYEDGDASTQKWIAPIRSDHAKETNELKVTKMDWPLRCLVFETIGSLALLAQKFDWTGLKFNYTGQLLVKMLSSCDATRNHEGQVLYFALRDVAKGCGFDDIPTLLIHHVDFMGRDLAILLRQMYSPLKSPSPTKLLGHQNHFGLVGIPTLLKVVLRLKNVGDYPGLRDALESLLDQLDLSWLHPNKSLTTKILRIILIFVQSFEATHEPLLKIESEVDFVDEPGSLTKFISDLYESQELDKNTSTFDGESGACPPQGFHDSKLTPENVQVTEEIELGTDLDEGPEEPEKPVSERTELIKEIVDHTRHFISMVKRPEWQIPALEIVGRCAVLLQPHKDELLPLVHLCWQSLKLLFSTENIFVADQAFKVLRTFARVAGDFIQRRTLKDAFPAILKYVKSLQIMIRDRNRHQTLIARQSRHLLQSLMEGLWDFMALLELDEREVDMIVEEMLEFVRFAREQKICEESQLETYFKPKRLVDHDTLMMKLEFQRRKMDQPERSPQLVD